MDLNMSDPPVQGVGLTVIQREQRQGRETVDHLTYWKRQLEGAPIALELPTDRPRQLSPSHVRGQYSFILPQPLSTALKTLSQQEGVSLFVTLLAAFQTLLYRYTGQDGLLVGTPWLESTQVKFNGNDDARHNVVNLLVLRARMEGNPSFRELIGRVYKVVWEAYAHQEVPFEQLVEVLQPERDSGRHPLCQVVFAMEEAGEHYLKLSSVDRAVSNGMAKIDLQLAVQDTTQELSVQLEYNADLFEEATIARMRGHWQTLLEGIVANPEQRLSELPLLTEAEQQLLIVDWNATAAEYPENQCIHQLFESQVERTPEALAVLQEDERLTYRELNQRANQLAHYLQRLGVGPEVPVGLYVERSLDMIVGLFGILKAGGAYIPLDLAYPKERLVFMLEDTRAPILVTQKHLREGLPKHTAQVVYLDSDEISQEKWENPVSSVMAENAAYIIYTSGSTGTPKGVVIEHKSLVNYIEAARIRYAFKPGERELQFASISFDASAEEIYPCLAYGATLVLRTNSMLDSVSQFLRKCQDWAITVLDLPTAYWHELTRKIAAEALMLPPSVRLVIIGGERALPEMVALWQKHVGVQVELVNTYGPTEATIVATWHGVSGSMEAGTTLREVPIGRPLANVQVYVLDKYLRAVPIGVPGELHIGGIGLARGYFNRPELTAEKFIPHPFNTEPGARLYKTGDLVRYLPTGDIEFLGRVDHQVKIRGFRIELGEIESVLGQHPAVQQVVVVAREDVPGDKRLVAYVVPRPLQTLTSGELRSAVQAALPNYMVPSAFVLLESLPLSPNGKIDRRALPAPAQSGREGDETFVAPTLPVHQQLAQIWEELLDVRPIGIRDNFFELGGHSLVAVRLIDRIEQVWGKKISSVTLLAGPTIEQLANVLVQPEDIDSVGPATTLKANGSKRAFSSVRKLLTSLSKTTRRL